MNSTEHVVHTDDPHPQSCAALVLLNQHFHRQDKDNPFVWMRFRKKFVKSRKKHCEYCGKTKMRKVSNKKGKPAHSNALTVDHAIPISLGGKRFDESNLRICCWECNSAKGSMKEFQFRVHLLKESWKHRKQNGLQRFFKIAGMFLITSLSRGNNFGFFGFIKKKC